ncbi:TOMM precursor leader peptide-binding protein [Nonomuraea sp. NPDC049714]|uniref:TOMM precursor leader peptide-binding protein n=1 Tax=Nonomuraea sp. NPDC049714 TaxID=3364357 RepID=UPI00379AC3C7
MTEVRADPFRPRAQVEQDVAVIGTGQIARAVAARGEGRITYLAVDAVHDLSTGVADESGYSALVVVSRGSVHAGERAVQEYASVRRMPWLPVHVDAGWITVGPLVRPPRPGCPLCVRRRQSRNRIDTAARRLLRDRSQTASQETGDSMVPPMLATAVARLVRDEVETASAGACAARTDGAILRLSLLDASVRRHRFLPDPWCPRCSDLPSDTGLGAALPRRPLVKAAPGEFRLHNLHSWVADRYVDAETGLIASVEAGSLAGTPSAVARLVPARIHSDSQHGFGRAVDYRSARLTALAEALERSAGERPGGRRSAVRGSYEELGDDAIDPRTLGTPPEELYRLPDYPFVPFAPDQRTSWVWGYSFKRSAPVLVPESIAYYGRRPETGPHWVFETSNGCAAGSCLEEAILYGLLEIAERDAFLMTWYGRLAVPRVDLDSAADRRIPLTVELLTRRFGCEVMAFSTMLEQRVPAFLTFAVNRTGEARPAMAFAAAAHLDPERAVRSALWELAALLEGLTAGLDLGAVEPMLADPLLVRDMEDHAALYTHPATLPRADFLDGDRPGLPLCAVSARAGWPRHADLSDDLHELVGRWLAEGMDVIAVDTTSTEQAAGGFASAKVIVPGTLPMTFGHRFRRTEGLPRLLTVPRLLGHRDRDLRPEEINPHPHPFP